MTPQTEKLLQDLANKLGVTVQYLWAVLVRGCRIEGAFMVFVAAALAGLVFVGYKIIQYARTDDCHEEPPYIIGGVLIGGVSLIFLFVTAYYAVMDLFAPEYAALLTILEKIGK